MSYKFKPASKDFRPDQALPQHLGHIPVYATPYQWFDGIYPNGETDIRYLSVGLAQYDENHVSIKAMRHTGEKWTRMAEELPLHRPVDMTIFLAKVLFDTHNESIELPKETFENQSVEISIHSKRMPEPQAKLAATTYFLPLMLNFTKSASMLYLQCCLS